MTGLPLGPTAPWDPGPKGRMGPKGKGPKAQKPKEPRRALGPKGAQGPLKIWPQTSKISKLHLEKPCRTQWSLLQTGPYVASYGRKPFRAWIGLEPWGWAWTGLEPWASLCRGLRRFFPGKNRCSPGTKVCFGVGNHVFGPQNHGRRCAGASGGFFPGEK